MNTLQKFHQFYLIFLNIEIFIYIPSSIFLLNIYLEFIFNFFQIIKLNITFNYIFSSNSIILI